GAPGDLLHRCEIAFRGDWETGLDDVDPHLVEQPGDFELFVMGHGGAGALLAVAQGGVENDDAVLFGALRPGGFGRGHGMMVLVSYCAAGGREFRVSVSRPLSSQANVPSRPSGAPKEQKTAENEGSTGQGAIRPP